MNEALAFVQKHRNAGALLHSNLLLVYLVGKLDRNQLSRFHHTKQYVDDFPPVEALVESFSRIHTTASVLTEVSNLGGKLGSKFFDVLRRAVGVLEEHYCASDKAVRETHFRKLGVTDSGLLSVGASVLIITADWQLYGILRSKNIDAVNFHHLRSLGVGLN